MRADPRAELLEYWRSIRQRQWHILSVAICVATATMAVVLVMPPKYQATSTALIEAGKAKILSIQDVYDVGAELQAKEHYQTQVEILRSRDIALRTVKSLKLATHPEFDPRRQESTPWSHIKRQVKEFVSGPTPRMPWTMETLNDAAVAKLMDVVDIEPVKLSQLVRITAETTDKALAAKIANAYIESYIEADREARFTVSQQASGWLQDRLTSLRDKLARSEAALQSFREKKSLVNIGGSAQTVAGQQVGGTTEKLVEARTKRVELESVYAQVQRVRDGDYGQIPAVMRDPGVARLLDEVNAAQAKVVELAARLGHEHMLLKEAKIQQQALQATLSAQRRAVADSIRRDYQAAKTTEQQLVATLSAARGDVQNVNRQEFELAVLEREVESNRQLYEMFMSRAKETSMTADVHAPIGRVVDAAREPTLPAKPKKTLVVLLAATAAGFLGTLVAMVLGKLNVTVRDGEEAETHLGAPLLATLPLVKRVKGLSMARLFLDQHHSHFAEGIRTARTGVLLTGKDAPKLVLVTSSLPEEGKTTTAINIAMAHAQAHKTLLIDADVRRPGIGSALHLPPDANGWTNLVGNHAAPNECLHFLPHCANLSVMPLGTARQAPAELLLSPMFKSALAQLKTQFDVIIIDSAPVELVSDALALVPLVSNVVFVVKSMSTPAPLAKRCIARLLRAGSPQLGLILNQLDLSTVETYHRRYAYGYQGEIPAAPMVQPPLKAPSC